MRKIDAFLGFLHVHPNWEEFLTSAPYNLKIQKEGEFVLFKYDQINSDLSNDFVHLVCSLRQTFSPPCAPYVARLAPITQAGRQRATPYALPPSQ